MKNLGNLLLLAGVAFLGYVVYNANKEEEVQSDGSGSGSEFDEDNPAGAVSTVIDDTGTVETDSGDTEEAVVDLNDYTVTLDPNETVEDTNTGETIYGDVLVTPFDRVQVRVRNLADGLYEFKAIVNESVQYVDHSGYNPDFEYPPISDWEFTTFNLNNGQGPINLLPDEVIEVQYTQNATISISAQWDFDNSLYDPTVNFDLEVQYLGLDSGVNPNTELDPEYNVQDPV